MKDLGYRKVAALLDGDKQKERAELSSEFADYFFACIPAKDIRTKLPRKATEEVQGLLDSEMKVKEEFVPTLGELFESLSKHMKS